MRVACTALIHNRLLSSDLLKHFRTSPNANVIVIREARKGTGKVSIFHSLLFHSGRAVGLARSPCSLLRREERRREEDCPYDDTGRQDLTAVASERGTDTDAG